MTDEKSIVEKVEQKAKELSTKVEELLDELSADEVPLKVTNPDSERLQESNKM